MKKLFKIFGVMFAVALAALATGAAVSAADKAVELKDLPEAAQAAIQKHSAGGEIVELEEETENGKTVYEAEVKRDGKEVDIRVSPTGELLGAEAEDDGKDDDEKDSDDEKPVAAGDVPKSVADALGKAIAGATVKAYPSEAEDGHRIYEATYEANGKKYEAASTEDGQVFEVVEFIPESGMPAAVKAAIEKQFPKAEIDEVEHMQLTYYEVKVEHDGKELEVKILSDGHILSSALED